MKCYTCGEPLSNIKEAFDMMRHILTVKEDQKTKTTHVTKRIVDADLNVILVDAFEALNLNRYCCRGHITSTINFHDLEYGN